MWMSWANILRLSSSKHSEIFMTMSSPSQKVRLSFKWLHLLFRFWIDSDIFSNTIRELSSLIYCSHFPSYKGLMEPLRQFLDSKLDYFQSNIIITVQSIYWRPKQHGSPLIVRSSQCFSSLIIRLGLTENIGLLWAENSLRKNLRVI